MWRVGLAALLLVGLAGCEPDPKRRDRPFTPVTPVSPAASTPPPEVFYRNCEEARAAGAAPLRAGEPGYRPNLDADRNGVACELEGGI